MTRATLPAKRVLTGTLLPAAPDPVTRLLTVLRDLHEDGALEDIYGVVDDGVGADAPLEVAIRHWARAGYPGAGP